jgi:hypothetical protein
LETPKTEFFIKDAPPLATPVTALPVRTPSLVFAMNSPKPLPKEDRRVTGEPRKSADPTILIRLLTMAGR